MEGVDPALVSAALEEHNFQEQRNNELAESLSNSLSSLRGIDGEALTMGRRVAGKMTIIRRNFCLFVLFDLLIVSFIWLILQMLTGDGDPIKIFDREILHYSIKSSLFDLVMTAACRFTVLILFYAVLQLDTKFFVALTTVTTCVFLIFKVIYFNWKESQQAAIQGSSFLVSFSLAWVEVWFLDMRVVPLEQQAKEAINRTDLSQQFFRNYIQTMGQASSRRAHPNDDNFFTPLNEPEDALDDPDRNLISANQLKWLQLATDAEYAVENYHNSLTWDSLEEGAIRVSIPSTNTEHLVFKIEALMASPAMKLLDELYDDVEYSTAWNTAISECTRFQIINSTSDLCYQVMQPCPPFSQRDMVIVRKRGKINGYDAISFVSVDHPTFPRRKHLTRFNNGPSSWIAVPHEVCPHHTYLVGVIAVEKLRMMPKFLIQRAVIASFKKVVGNLQVLLDNRVKARFPDQYQTP